MRTVRLDSTTMTTIVTDEVNEATTEQTPAEAPAEAPSAVGSKLETAEEAKINSDAPALGLRKRKDLRGERPSVVVASLAESFLPSKLKPLAKKVGPLLDLAADVWSKAQPHVKKARALCRKVHEKLEPYHPEEWGPMIIGIILCFFGGFFATTVAAFEAFRITSYANVKQCCQIIYADQIAVAQAWKKDDCKDENHNGTADVAELSDQELAKHKFLLVCRTVDPSELARAFAGINTGLLAVLATLRVHFAQAVTLGAAIGITINHLLAVQVIPHFEKKTSPDFRKWVKPLFNYGTKTVGFLMALILWRSIMALYSSTRGAQMACEGMISYLARNKYVQVPTREGNYKLSKEFVLSSTLLAALGFYWQISHGFSLPFPFNFVLLPLTIFEGMLSYCIAA